MDIRQTNGTIRRTQNVQPPTTKPTEAQAHLIANAIWDDFAGRNDGTGRFLGGALAPEIQKEMRETWERLAVMILEAKEI